MPVTGIFWPAGAGQDFHLIPGVASPRLDHLLWIEDTTGTVRADNPPPGVTVTWSSNYAAVAAAAIGVTVDVTSPPFRGSGMVTVTGPLAAPTRLLDFLVIATVTDGTDTFSAYIRFHIHAAITTMWLTPSELTVPEGAHNMRFSMLAEFSDGTYGDITNWSPFEVPAGGDFTSVHLPGNPNPIFQWGTSAVGVMDVDSRTGVLNCRPGALNTLTTISAVAPLASPNPSTASGKARGGSRWNAPVRLHHIAGPGGAAIDDVPNVLILGDGFDIGEGQAFVDLAGELVKGLHTSPRTRPFDLVKNRMNYFAAFRASREQGIATLGPVIRSLTGTAFPFDAAVEPAAAATLSATRGAPPTPATNTVFLFNERDTAFGAALGERPRAERNHAMREAFLSEHRFSEDDFDAFLGALEYPAGNPVGQRWARGGGDQGSILVLCRTDLLGGANTSRIETTGLQGDAHIICMTLGVADRAGIAPAASPLPGQDIVPDAIPKKPTVDMRTTAAHELAHSYTLDDEYGGFGEATIADEQGAAEYANVQSRDELLRGTTFLQRLKWRWPRLVHAARLTSPPVLAGPEHRLFFVPGDPTNFPPETPPRATDFPVDTIVRLRTRPLPGSQQSYRLRVTQVVGDAEVFVEPAEPVPAGAPALPATFPAESIVMEPKRSSDPPGDDLELVHADVRQWIEQESNPLNATPGAPAFRDCKTRHDPPLNEPPEVGNTPARNFGPGRAPKKPTESAMLTGLFEGGSQFDCNIYHPTGACAMNVIEVQPGSSYQFCWVCRYAMVDFIDPAMHGLIDRDYDYRYPP